MRRWSAICWRSFEAAGRQAGSGARLLSRWRLAGHGNFRSRCRYDSPVFIGWAAQVFVVLTLRHFHVPNRAYSIGLALCLLALHLPAGILEPYVGGWRNVPGDIPGPWWYQAWRRISTPVLAAADNEFLTDMFCYLLVTSLIPLSIGILAGVKIGWLATSKSEVITNA